MTVTDIQQALSRAGFDPGPIDGIRGRKTIVAIKKFQIANNLVPDGIVGPKTSAILLGKTAPAQNTFSIPVTLPWLDEAFRLIGTQEQPGAGSNEAILGWARNLDLNSYGDDDIPWCGLFVAHCIGSQMPDEPIPTNPLGARNWQKFGHKVTPALGSIMVFWRGDPQGWKGHVGFYWAEDEDGEAYHILGGNQSNSVSITRIGKERLLTARWPETDSIKNSVVRIASKKGKLLSTNEA